MFEHTARVEMAHTDAAGVVFFARYFDLLHRAYEDLMRQLGFPLEDLLARGGQALPVIHASADYRLPLFYGECYRVEIRVLKVGRRHFELGHRLLKEHDSLCCEATTAHTLVQLEQKKAIPLPDALRSALLALE